MRNAWLAALISIPLVAPAAAEGMTDGDRQRLLAHLEMTENWLASEVRPPAPPIPRPHDPPAPWPLAP